MENASKALIMAGSILLVIMIIGLLLFSSVSDSLSDCIVFDFGKKE